MHIATDAEPVIARDATDAARSARASGRRLSPFRRALFLCEGQSIQSKYIGQLKGDAIKC
eukprot:31032-Pelagococcus_subviridis.AAC.26